MKIVVRDLAVRYGQRLALEGVDLEVEPGSVFALLGRNGAGKTSLVRVLLGQRPAAAGTVALGSYDPWRERKALMRRIGATPETPDAPAHLLVDEIASSCRPLYPSWDTAGFQQRLDRFGIPSRTRFGDLSRGQKGLVHLALALAHRPELLVLDDPTLGLDPIARRFVFGELVDELADRKTTTFVTSHDLKGIERVATHVGILRQGRLIACGEFERLRADAVHSGVASPSLEEIFLLHTATPPEGLRR